MTQVFVKWSNSFTSMHSLWCCGMNEDICMHRTSPMCIQNHMPLIKSLLKGSSPIPNKRNHTFGKWIVDIVPLCKTRDQRPESGPRTLLSIYSEKMSKMKLSQSVLDVLVHCSLPRITQLSEKFLGFSLLSLLCEPFWFNVLFLFVFTEIVCILYS